MGNPPCAHDRGATGRRIGATPGTICDMRAKHASAAIAIAGLLLAGCGGSATAPVQTQVTAASTTDATATAGVRVVSAGAAVTLIADNARVIDVRTPEEFTQGHVAGAVNISVEASDFATRIGELDRDGRYVVYCRSGRRSAIAAQQMKSAGFTDVADAGGLDALTAAGIATE